jgi:hypothetical protein
MDAAKREGWSGRERLRRRILLVIVGDNGER